MVATAQALAVNRTTRVRRCRPSDSLSIVSLPLSVSAWGLGREARRSTTRARGAAGAGHVLGIVGTLLALAWLAAAAAILL